MSQDRQFLVEFYVHTLVVPTQIRAQVGLVTMDIVALNRVLALV